jgi:hypothetical protein
VTGTTVVLVLLATYRLALLVSADTITAEVRHAIDNWAAVYEPDHPAIGPSWRHGLAYLVHCPWCCSLWLGVPVAAAAVWAPDAWWFQWPALALAGSAAAGYLASYATPE